MLLAGIELGPGCMLLVFFDSWPPLIAHVHPPKQYSQLDNNQLLHNMWNIYKSPQIDGNLIQCPRSLLSIPQEHA
jgi:hypothetical protein